VFDKAEARILSWSRDETLRLWNASTGQPLGTPMKHHGPVDDTVFDKPEARILSWSVGSVRLWDAATGQLLGTLMKHDGPVYGALFDKAEARPLSRSRDSTIRLWDAAKAAAPDFITFLLVISLSSSS
jgi:WD40 repeat protein